jgi:hypothetical protein
VASTSVGYPALALAVILYCCALSAPQQDPPWRDQAEVDVTPTKDQFLLGEPISVKVQVTNLYTEKIEVRYGRGRYFRLTALDSSGKALKDRTKTQLSAWSDPIPVVPEADCNDVVFVNRHVEFPGPGVYAVSYRGCIDLREGPPGNRGADKKTITLSGAVNVELGEGSAEELEEAVRQYVKQLGSDDAALGDQAARALIASEPTLTVRLLREALQDEEGFLPSQTAHVTWVLARIRTDEAIQLLLDLAVGSDHWMARTEAIDALGRFHIKQAVPTLVDLLSDPDSRVRASALQSLGEIGDTSSVSQVQTRLNDPDGKVRDVARRIYAKLTVGKATRNRVRRRY